HGYRIRNAAAGIADAILDGIKDTIVEGVAGMVDVFEFLVNKIVDGVKDFLGISSPYRVFMEIGEYMEAGLADGVDDHDSVNRSMRDLGHDAVKGFKKVVSAISDSFANMTDLNPTITPVLDLSRVATDAKGLSTLLPDGLPIGGTYAQAVQIVRDSEEYEDDDDVVDGDDPRGPTFIQNNYSPKALTTADIYKKTRNQVAMAKEEMTSK